MLNKVDFWKENWYNRVVIVIKVMSRIIMGIGWMILPIMLLGAFFGNETCAAASKILLAIFGGISFLVFAAVCWGVGLMILHGEFDGRQW